MEKIWGFGRERTHKHQTMSLTDSMGGLSTEARLLGCPASHSWFQLLNACHKSIALICLSSILLFPLDII